MGYGFATEALGFLFVCRLVEYEVVEVQNGSAFALVTEPGLLAVAPRTAAVNEVENRRAVFVVKLFDFAQSSLYDLIVPGSIGLLVGCCISDKGVEKILRTALESLPFAGAVDVAKIVDLKLFEQLDGLFFVLQNGRHNDHSGVFLRYKAVFEFEFECACGFVNLVKQLVEEVDYYLAHRNQKQNDKCQT